MSTKGWQQATDKLNQQLKQYVGNKTVHFFICYAPEFTPTPVETVDTCPRMIWHRAHEPNCDQWKIWEETDLQAGKFRTRIHWQRGRHAKGIHHCVQV